MSPEHRTPGSVDPPEPEEVLARHPPRRHDHEPSDEDDREVLLDDPALPEIAVEDDPASPRAGHDTG